MAAPAMMPNPNKMTYNASNTIVPDINGDGYVDAVDAGIIDQVFADLSVTPPIDPGLTPEQLKACDANMNGYIDAVDSAWVRAFYAKISSSDNPYRGLSLEAAWAAYINDRKNAGGDVY